MTSEGKTSTEQLDLLMKALKTSIRKALDDELIEKGPWGSPAAPAAPPSGGTDSEEKQTSEL